MSKKKYNDEDDYDFEEYDSPFNSEKDELASLLEQYKTYKTIDVDVVKLELTAKAAKLIKGISKIYLDDKIIDDDYRDAITDVEIDNFSALIKQVKYAEHMVDSMMRRLDNGGYVDKNIFKEIRSMQKHLIEITKEISAYTRNLPEYFKFIESDNKTSEFNDNQVYPAEIAQSNVQQIQHTNNEDDLLIFMSKPQRGTRDLMLTISDSLTEINQKLEEMPDSELDFNPSDIIDDEELDDLEDGSLEE